MLKKIIAVCCTSLLSISMVSCNEKKTHTSDISFITQNSIEYNNGCVYGENPTRYLDFETLESSPLCAVPNCTHKNNDCLAKQIGNTPIFYDDFVFFFESNNGNVRETPDGMEFFIDSKLKKASLNSSKIEVVCEFHDSAPVDGYIGMVLNGNELFFVTDDLNPQKDEYGGYDWGNCGGNHYICSINLDTGKYSNYGSIYDGDKEYAGAPYSSHANITGLYDNKIFIRYSFIKDNDALQSGNVDFDLLWTHLNFEFDFETKTWSESKLPFGWYIFNDTYTYYDNAKEMMKVIYKGTEKEFPCDSPKVALKASNGKLFLTDDGKFYDLNTMAEYNMGDYSKYEIMGYSNGNYILKSGKKAIKLTEEELLTLDKE